MKPKRIILVRHGQSEGNEDSLNYETIPDYALNLTTQGKQQAISAGKEIAAIIGDEKINAYISPYDRTRQTYDGIASVLNDQIQVCHEDPRIR